MAHTRVLWTGLLLGVFLCAARLAATPAAPEEEKHSNPAKSCVSKDCHPDIIKHKYNHGPVVIGNCTVCHAPLPGNQHKFKVEQSDTKLCATCHQRVDTEPNLHDPVAKGLCLKCHDPHGSEEPYQVRRSPQVQLCDRCHKPVLTGKYAHKPVARGECLSCHRAHGSKTKKLLDAEGSKLCLQQCHEKLRPVMVAGKEQKAHLTSEDCSRCHRPHDSTYPSLLVRPPGELCLDGCHKEIKEKIVSSEFKHEVKEKIVASEFKHDATTKGLPCIECHRAHDNRFGRLLRKPAAELCFTCHDELQKQVAGAEFKHRPVADKSCSSCHVPHGSAFGKLLFADYASDTSFAFDPSKYAVCFSCHAEKLVRERYTDTNTDFRNGRLNLHYLHVDKEGRTCRACHSDHAGNQPKLIRDQAQLGNGTIIPFQFKKSNTGGSCLAGCHAEYTYDRVNPVRLNAQ
jgi:predicted CXXCH cytochrome family protein